MCYVKQRLWANCQEVGHSRYRAVAFKASIRRDYFCFQICYRCRFTSVHKFIRRVLKAVALISLVRLKIGGDQRGKSRRVWRERNWRREKNNQGQSLNKIKADYWEKAYSHTACRFKRVQRLNAAQMLFHVCVNWFSEEGKPLAHKKGCRPPYQSQNTHTHTHVSAPNSPHHPEFENMRNMRAWFSFTSAPRHDAQLAHSL